MVSMHVGIRMILFGTASTIGRTAEGMKTSSVLCVFSVHIIFVKRREYSGVHRDTCGPTPVGKFSIARLTQEGGTSHGFY